LRAGHKTGEFRSGDSPRVDELRNGTELLYTDKPLRGDRVGSPT